jgi:hypothetical protein
MATWPTYLIAGLRIGTGIGLLAFPRLALRVSALEDTISGTATVLARLVGNRDLVVGALLWYVLERWRKAAAEAFPTESPMSGQKSTNRVHSIGGSA